MARVAGLPHPVVSPWRRSERQLEEKQVGDRMTRMDMDGDDDELGCGEDPVSVRYLTVGPVGCFGSLATGVRFQLVWTRKHL